jgi:hypothetical protein
VLRLSLTSKKHYLRMIRKVLAVFEQLIQLTPLPFSPVPGALAAAAAIDGKGWVLSLSLSLSPSLIFKAI